MKKKLMRRPKVVTILVAGTDRRAIFWEVGWVAHVFLASTVSLPGLWKQYDRRVYGRSGCISAFMPVWLSWSSGRKRKGIYPWSLYWRIPDRILLSGTGGTTLCADDDTGCKSCICIGNPVFCCNHVSDRMDGGTYFPRCDPESVSGTFFQNEKRDSLGGHSQWCIVRGGTFDKYFTGSDCDGVR